MEPGSMAEDSGAQELLQEQHAYLKEVFIDYCEQDVTSNNRDVMSIRSLHMLANDVGLVPTILSTQGTLLSFLLLKYEDVSDGSDS